MKTGLITDIDCLITNCKTHDLRFKGVSFEDSKVIFKLWDGDSFVTFIEIDAVVFIQIGKIVPDGIVLSCYDFELISPPESADLPDLLKIKKSYHISDVARVFYCDGAYGLDVMVIYNGTASVEADGDVI